VLATWPEARPRLLLNSDSGTRFYEDLWVFRNDGSRPAHFRDAIARDNAARFFGFPD